MNFKAKIKAKSQGCWRHSGTRKTDVSWGAGRREVEHFFDVVGSCNPYRSIARRGDVPYPSTVPTSSFSHAPKGTAATNEINSRLAFSKPVLQALFR